MDSDCFADSFTLAAASEEAGINDCVPLGLPGGTLGNHAAELIFMSEVSLTHQTVHASVRTNYFGNSRTRPRECFVVTEFRKRPRDEFLAEISGSSEMGRIIFFVQTLVHRARAHAGGRVHIFSLPTRSFEACEDCRAEAISRSTRPLQV